MDEKQFEKGKLLIPYSLNLIPTQDFYIENGLYVFTEHFLIKRGFCCDNGCRHCPYKSKTDVKTYYPDL